MKPLCTDSLQLKFATRVFEANELDTVRMQNDPSITDLQMQLRYAYHPLGFQNSSFSSPCYLPYIACIASSSSEPKSALPKSFSYSEALTSFFTFPAGSLGFVALLIEYKLL